MRLLSLVLAGAALFIGTSLPAQATAAPSAVGEWLGTLRASGVELRLGLSVRANPDGTLSSDLDSYDQGAMNIPADTTVQTGAVLRVVILRAAGGYEGTISADGQRMTGTWRQGPGSIPLEFTRADSAALAAAAPRRPQLPRAPFPYAVEEVSFESVPGVRLAGTLTRPNSAGPHPTVVLISGSGPQDRDETLLGHKPFLVLADYLTRRGIAVLRYDDRGFARSTGDFANATSADFAEDVRAAVRFLRARKDVGKVGLVGHSEGGLIAPMVARTPGVVDMIVLLAGPGVPGDSILLTQAALIGRAQGVPESTLQSSQRASRRMYALVREARDTVGLRDRLLAEMRQYAQTVPAEQRSAMGATDAAINAQVAQVMSPWFRYFITYDPRPALRATRVPVLALNGTLDLQVPYEANVAGIRTALSAGRNRDFDVRALPGLNHLFQTARTGAPREYQTIEETFAPSALQIVGDWLVARGGIPVTKER